jgi:TolB-like protein/DNA-binding winged helix-turn-helix (wHTH) protein/Tfp pilus assembly protein PilF
VIKFGACMSAPASVARVLRFEAFELDLHAGELRKRGVKLRLQGQPIQVLAILLQSAGNLVTREELRSQLWPADTFVDFDHSLHNSIGRIREALGDSAEMPRYIETLPRRGYRFIAPVEEVQALRIGGENGNGTEDAVAVAPQPKAPPPTRHAGLILTLIFCGAIVLASWAAWQHSYAKSTVVPIHSIAVLPMQNLSADAAQEYFADGMTDQLITELAKVGALRVTSRTSVMRYKGTKKALPEIARELNVDAIVEGSVIRSGQRLRVTAQLLQAPTDKHLWAETYDRDVGDILRLQAEVADAIAQQVRAQLAPMQQSRAHTVNPEAYDAYLRGRLYFVNEFTKADSLKKAQAYFEEAIQKDPGFALAYAGLADTYVYMAFAGALQRDQAYRSAKDALAKALALDDSIGEAHDTLGLLSSEFDWDWETANREFNRAIALAPSYSCAHEDRAEFLALVGRRAEALAEITKIDQLDYGFSAAHTESATYYELRDYPDLIEASRRGLLLDPKDWSHHYTLGVGYEGTGKLPEAISEYQQAVELSAGDPGSTAALAHAFAAAGRKAEAEKILHDFQRKSKSDQVSPYLMATMFASLGDKDRAFAFLEKAYQARSFDMTENLKADLRIDNLRSDPRFQALVQRVGLPQ